MSNERHGVAAWKYDLNQIYILISVVIGLHYNPFQTNSIAVVFPSLRRAILRSAQSQNRICRHMEFLLGKS